VRGPPFVESQSPLLAPEPTQTNSKSRSDPPQLRDDVSNPMEGGARTYLPYFSREKVYLLAIGIDP